MTAVPANQSVDMVFQDNRGFKALVRINGYQPDLSADGVPLNTYYGQVTAIASATAALSNTKLVRIAFGWSYDYAQEPSTETGTYELVIQKARLRGGDGVGGVMYTDIPGPKDSIFITSGSDNLIVVNPASSLIAAFQTACNALFTPRGGTSYAQFNGGQLVQGKPRVRRVVQGA